MLYETPGETFVGDPEYVADAVPYVIAASSQLPCPSCLTGLMQPIADDEFSYDLDDFALVYEGFRCQSCQRRVLIERVA